MLQVICRRDALYEAVQIVSRGVSGRSTQPVQNNVFLESRADQLRLVATDLEFISVQAEVEVQMVAEGAVTAPARLLAEVCNSLPEGDVTLAAAENQSLGISCGKAQYNIRGLPAADFQQFPPIAEGLRVSVPQGQLSDVLKQTVFATSRDETRPILTGALFSLSESSLQVVATDTYRLAMRKMQLAAPVEAPRSAIVSNKALHELVRVLSSDGDQVVNVAVSDNQIEFEVGKVRVASRLIEGQFPNYQKVIPDAHEKRLTVVLAEFEQSLRRAIIVAREDANRVVLRASGETLQISAESPDVGKVLEEVPCQLQGEPAEIAFNCRYLLDVIEALSAEEVHLDLAGPLNPGMIRAGDGEDYLYVLMPMQIM